MIKKMYVISPDLVAAVKAFAKDNPEYTHNDRPSESAVVRDAITLFLASKSNKLNQESDNAA